MTDDVLVQRLDTLKRWVPPIYGCVLTLLFIVILGDMRHFIGEAPAGMFILWGLTSLVCVPIGLLLLLKRPWGSVPMKARRGTAMGYLLVGFVNLVGLGLFSVAGAGGTLCLLVPIPYAALLGVAWLRAYWIEDRDTGDVFP